LINDFCEDQSQGYCSDGDFRKISIRYSDIETGYLSESGVSSPLKSLYRNRPSLPTTIEER
jgi:hypothetical protein